MKTPPPLKWNTYFGATGNSKWQWFVRGPGGVTIADGFEDTADAACEAVITVLETLKREGRLQHAI